MKIIKEGKFKEAYSSYDIENMANSGELGMLCDGLLDELSNAVFQIKETDKLENFFTKHYRSAPGFIKMIENAIEILYSAKKKG